MRYFYRDPLAAAWMQKHFGMRLHDADFDEPTSAPPEEIAQWGVGPICIHPESLPIMAPVIGDLYYNSCNGSYHTVTEKGSGRRLPNGEKHWEDWDCHYDDITLEQALDWWNDGKSSDRIIQRNGLAFHWPESEGA
jgi:hypothetical protein